MLIKTVVSDYRCKQAIANILVCNVDLLQVKARDPFQSSIQPSN